MTFTSPWPICQTCQAIPLTIFRLQTDGRTSYVHQLWESFTAFAESASRGCHVCTLLYESVRNPYKSSLDSAAVHLESAFVEGECQVVLTVDLSSAPDFGTSDHKDAVSPFRYLAIASVKFTSDSDQIPATAKHFTGLVSLFDEDAGAIQYTRQAMATCLKEHSQSCDRVIFPFGSRQQITNIVAGAHGMVVAPTRLIDVGQEDVTDSVKLVDGQNCLHEGGYIVLSYCWGFTPKDAQWQLTTKTMEHFAASISMAILPQTIHDAILWARRLNHRYIWIDSMCIIQDSKDDWQREASNMGSIYGSATMTLVAASSSVYGGITDRRNPVRNCAAALDLDPSSGGASVYILPNGQKSTTPTAPPTDSRAWCYQEDLLSSRLVLLTCATVVWQCLGRTNPSPGRAQGLERLKNHPPFRWYVLWYRLIERYSCKKITYPTDKLPAFYGVALDKATGGYMAGFVKDDPWASLLWCRDENQIRRRPGLRYAEYVAPSWSWASIDSPVLFYEASARSQRKSQLEALRIDPELLNAEVKASSSIETGSVKSGFVEIMAESAIMSTTKNEPFLFNTKLGSHTCGRRNLVDPRTGAMLGLIVFDVAGEACDGISLCGVLLHTVHMSHWEMNGTAGLGIALRLVESPGAQTTWTRIGYVQFTPAFMRFASRARISII